MNKKLLLIPVALVLMGLGLYFFIFSNNDTLEEDQSEITTSLEEQNIDPNDGSADTPLNPNEILEQQNSDPGTATRPSDDEPSKQPVAEDAVKTPVVYTGYGHNSKQPLPKGQATSTSCTTSADTSCRVELKNQATGLIVKFESQTTDQEGVTVWEWTGDKEVKSGTWIVTAHAGDKISNKETIYVE